MHLRSARSRARLRFFVLQLALWCVAGWGSVPAHAEANWKAFSNPAGQPPLPLVLDDLSGKSVDLAQFKGQVVLLNFWATWCDGCRAEIPALNRLQLQYRSRHLHVVGINVGEGRARIAEFRERVPIEFDILRDVDSLVLKTWHVRIMPMTFLIDRNGMLRYQLVGEADWNDPAVQAPLLELLKQEAP